MDTVYTLVLIILSFVKLIEFAGRNTRLKPIKPALFTTILVPSVGWYLIVEMAFYAFVFSIKAIPAGIVTIETGYPGIKFHGDLFIAHFVGMHALRIFPLMAGYLFTSPKMTISLALIYTLMTAFIFMEAPRGNSITKICQPQ